MVNTFIKTFREIIDKIISAENMSYLLPKIPHKKEDELLMADIENNKDTFEEIT